MLVSYLRDFPHHMYCLGTFLHVHFSILIMHMYIHNHIILKPVMVLNLTDGQKIAKRLATSITKETKKIKQFLEEYNVILAQLKSQLCTVAEILDVDSTFWTTSHNLVAINASNETSLSHKKKLIEAYITMKRSDEELKMLTHEMQNTTMYWHTRKMHIKKQLRLVKESPLSTTGTSYLYLRGTQCLFTKLFYEAEQFLLRCEIAFSQFIPLVSLCESSQHSSPSGIDDSESESHYSMDSMGFSDDSDEEDSV